MRSAGKSIAQPVTTFNAGSKQKGSKRVASRCVDMFQTVSRCVKEVLICTVALPRDQSIVIHMI